jgi:VIT1/CCC1 family predicted Fe2+/Mn2+ transporter
MDEQNKEQSDVHQHVHLFGAEVNASGEGSAKTKEERRASKEEWRQKHHEQREQWRAEHREWRHEHCGGHFGGLVILFLGVMALLYTMGFVSHGFWYAIAPFWPILLILWGASIILGHHWFARVILFLFALMILAAVIFYGLVKSDSPLVSSLAPHVVSALQNTQPQY